MQKKKKTSDKISKFFKQNPITKADIFAVFEPLKLAKKAEVADKLYTDMKAIFKYAINKDLLDNSPLANLDRKDLLYKAAVKHYPTITDKDGIQRLLGDIKNTNADM